MTTTPTIEHYRSHADLRPPADWPYATVCWLLARHPDVEQTMRRIPGALDTDGDPDVQALADVIRAHDAWRDAWADYERSTRAPRGDDDAEWEAWESRGPSRPAGSDAFGVMSGGERRRLRTLATLAGTPGVRWSIDDTFGLDDAGQFFLRDWADAVTAR